MGLAYLVEYTSPDEPCGCSRCNIRRIALPYVKRHVIRCLSFTVKNYTEALKTIAKGSNRFAYVSFYAYFKSLYIFVQFIIEKQESVQK